MQLFSYILLLQYLGIFSPIFQDTVEPQTIEKDFKADDDLNGLVEKFVENLAEQAQVVVEAIKDSAEKLPEDEEILDDQEEPNVETKDIKEKDDTVLDVPLGMFYTPSLLPEVENTVKFPLRMECLVLF